MVEIVYRPARLDEAADILAVLIKLAPEIPVPVEPLEREEALANAPDAAHDVGLFKVPRVIG